MMAEAIELVSESDDLREQLRSGVRELAREWHSWETMTERLIDILGSAVEKGSAGAPSAEPRARSAVGRGTAPEEQRPAPSTPTLVRGDVATGASSARPPVSVVVAVYNVDKYLSRCLDALVHQTLPGVEVIVVNDASTDDSPAIIGAYRARYPNVRVVHCAQNRGLASVRNLGMSVATGEYIAFADGDDWVDVNMCEVLYEWARADEVDVVIADTKVFYEDTKEVRPFFDQPLRKVLDPELRRAPFDIQSEPAVLLLEPVAWTKIYRTSFLRQHSIRFEDGMNSYEDVCFHFWVLVKAATISLTDVPIANYRQNRPGQISGRRSRKVFEAFDVFGKIHDNLTAWNVSPDVWAMFLRVQIKQFDWMLRDRVHDSYKREFIRSVAKLMGLLPPKTFDRVIWYASREEMAKLACLRRGWLFAYERIAKKGWPKFPLADIELKERWTALARGAAERTLGRARRRIGRLGKSPLDTPAVTVARLDRRDRVPHAAATASEAARPFEAYRVDGQMLLLASPTDGAAVADAVRRIEHDHYLTRTATLREGDTVVDVGAHVGTLSIFLAKKYPFLRVIAVEPEPRNYRCLVRNIEANGLTNVLALNKAIGGTVREETLYADASNSDWATLDPDLVFAPGPRRAVHTSRVDTTTLEELFLDHEVSHCRVLKLTAPGAVGDSLGAFTLDDRVDLLCGEVDLSDCTRGRLEVMSQRIARQFFWRTISRSGVWERRSWLHRAPAPDEWRGLLRDAARSLASASARPAPCRSP
jgi:glycosyltransferase EpsH